MWWQGEVEVTMQEMVESTITSHSYVAHVPVPSQQEVCWLFVTVNIVLEYRILPRLGKVAFESTPEVTREIF